MAVSHTNFIVTSPDLPGMLGYCVKRTGAKLDSHRILVCTHLISSAFAAGQYVDTGCI